MTKEEKIKDKLYVLFQRHQLTGLHIREAVDLAYKAVKENDFIDDVIICPKCDNPHPHHLKYGFYSCDKCGNEWA